MAAPGTPTNVDKAMRWLLDTPPEQRPKATMSLLRELFGLSNREAVDAIMAANAARYGYDLKEVSDAS